MAPLKLLNFLLVSLSNTILTAAQGTQSPTESPTTPALSGPDTSFCEEGNSVIASANLTGVYNIPGLTLGEGGLRTSDEPSQQWELTHTLTLDEEDIAYEEGFLTVPTNQTPESLPYSACAKMFFVPDEVARTRQTDDASCGQIFGQDCARDLKALYQSQATAALDADEPEEGRCWSFFDTAEGSGFPESCRNSTESILAVSGIENSIRFDASDRICPASLYATAFSETAADHDLDAGPERDSNTTAFDIAKRAITAYVLVRFGNSTADAGSFANVELVCARATNPRGETRTPENNATEDNAAGNTSAGDTAAGNTAANPTSYSSLLLTVATLAGIFTML